MANYYQPEIETMPVEQIQALQSERLTEQVKYVYENVKFYHDKMDELGVKPEDVKGIDDLHKLPFIDKNDLRTSIHMGCWEFRCPNVCGFSRQAVPRGAVSCRFIPRRTLTCGRSAVQGQLWRQAARRMTCAMSAMVTDFLQEDRG